MYFTISLTRKLSECSSQINNINKIINTNRRSGEWTFNPLGNWSARGNGRLSLFYPCGIRLSMHCRPINAATPECKDSCHREPCKMKLTLLLILCWCLCTLGRLQKSVLKVFKIILLSQCMPIALSPLPSQHSFVVVTVSVGVKHQPQLHLQQRQLLLQKLPPQQSILKPQPQLSAQTMTTMAMAKLTILYTNKIIINFYIPLITKHIYSANIYKVINKTLIFWI